MQTGGQWTMASNRGPNAVGGSGGGSGGFGAPPVADAPRHDDSEYYKARNATGSAFNWASSGGNAGAAGGGGAPPSPARGVGGSWASVPAPVAPPPPAVHTPQLSVAAQSRMEANQSSPYSRGAAAPAPAVVGTSAEAGTYEKNLIAELCPPGGMKAEPPQDKLEDFARAVPSLNPDLVCPALLDALEDGNPWIMRAKALCVIETVLKVMDGQGGGGGESNAYADFFHACAGEIEPLANHARQSVNAPAKRVLALLGVAPGVVSPPTRMNGGAAPSFAAPPTVTSTAAEAPNLLDFDGPSDVPAPVSAPAPPPPAPPAVSSTSGGDSMFGGMTMKGATGSAMPSTNSPATPALVSTESTESSGDLLGSFSFSTDPAPAAPAPVAPVPAASSGSDSLFGNMTVKSSSIPPVEPVAAAAPAADASSIGPPSSGSAFGFMNATTPSTPSQPAKTKVMSDVPKSPAASYDPLLTLGSTNSPTKPNGGGMNNMNQMGQMNPSAQMTPAQMQQMQMAYQQNMMMMQQQMQQMQMGGGAGGGAAYGRQGSGPNPNVMGANYMRQVPGVQGDNSSFSFLSAPKKKDTHEFDFVKDAMKRG